MKFLFICGMLLLISSASKASCKSMGGGYNNPADPIYYGLESCSGDSFRASKYDDEIFNDRVLVDCSEQARAMAASCSAEEVRDVILVGKAVALESRKRELQTEDRANKQHQAEKAAQKTANDRLNDVQKGL